MKFTRYENLLDSIYNGLNGREEIEWSNVWIDSANEKTNVRYLLIGDSTMRMVRSTFARLTSCSVDLIGTSSKLNDKLFVDLIDTFFSGSIYKYDAIFVQLGHHDRVGIDGKDYVEKDYAKFYSDFDCLIKFLQQFSNKIVVESIFESYCIKKTFVKKIVKHIPSIKLLYRLGVLKEKTDDNISFITNKKTDICRKIVATYGGANIVFADVNSYMKNLNYYHIDHIHFEDKAKIEIARFMQKYI